MQMTTEQKASLSNAHMNCMSHSMRDMIAVAETSQKAIDSRDFVLQSQRSRLRALRQALEQAEDNLTAIELLSK